MKRMRILSLILAVFCLAGGIAVPTRAAGKGEGNELELTQAERDFIRNHPSIRLGVDPSFVPYEFIDSDGIYKGVAADYIALIEQKTGLDMVVTPGLTWAEAYEKAISNQIDVLPCVAQTTERERYFLFSDTYFTFQRAVFINEDTTGINTFDDLAGKSVAVQINSSHHSYMLDFPEIQLNLYPTVVEALEAVSSGAETAFVGNLATSSYLAKSNGITNLKYFTIESDPNGPSQSLHFAVRKDWPELVSILNKAIASITKEEKTAINNKWIGVEGTVDYADIMRIVEISGFVIAVILTVSYFWIIRLRKEIEKRRAVQEALVVAKEEAEQANQIKSLFLARMSHEIRTPLSAIMGMAYLMKKTELSVTQGLYLDKLAQAARNMLGTINDILDFSKIEAGKITIEKISFDLDQVLQRIVNIASVKSEEQGIELTMEKDAELPSFFLGDPLRIEQILLNLLNNAVKFTQDGSVKLRIRAANGAESGGLIEFSVADTGIGMSREQIDHLFIPFDQGDSSISRRFGGSGLGLSIVKSLVDLMGGEIEVSSEEGKGSVFTVRLPLAADAQPERNKIKHMAADCFSRTRALVIDLNETSGAQIAEYVRSFGISTDRAASELDAPKLIRKAAEEEEKPYNLILVAFSESGEGGAALIRRLRNSPYSTAACKYIAILPLSREDMCDELETAGIDLSIMKPVIPSVLYNGIIEIFDISPPEMQYPVKKQNDPVPLEHSSILLVEDNRTNQFIAKTILEQAGFQVSLASNGEEGCRFFFEHRSDIDLILMDLHMPVMDGYAASDSIRAVDQNIPIIAMTADAIAGVEEKCRSHGIYNYVSKPFEPEQLIETIHKMLKDSYSAASASKLPAEKDTGVVLDTADGLKRIGGEAEIYRLVLQEFANENRPVGVQLKQAIDQGDYAAAVQIVHKIKSSSGSIGAASLHDTASELQKALQDAKEDAAMLLYEQFQTRFAALLQAVDAYLSEGQSK
ncbi:MAG: transporter substrate-binding domain-containing protein [Eubacteriales bacterium]|nr:transporter substrate-binding domain-containing protein [Eubacteriales bacterium]